MTGSNGTTTDIQEAATRFLTEVMAIDEKKRTLSRGLQLVRPQKEALITEKAKLVAKREQLVIEEKWLLERLEASEQNSGEQTTNKNPLYNLCLTSVVDAELLQQKLAESLQGTLGLKASMAALKERCALAPSLADLDKPAAVEQSVSGDNAAAVEQSAAGDNAGTCEQ